MKARLSSIATYLPELIQSNEDLARENPSWNTPTLAEKSGVLSRHIAAPGQTAYDLAVQALENLRAGGEFDPAHAGGVIFCTQSPDYIMPQNSHLVHKYLRLPDAVPVFDLNLACSGFIYGAMVAASLIESGIADNILLITAETYSKFINRADRSARVLFGDGAAVTLISSSAPGYQIVDGALCSNGENFHSFMIPAGGMRRPRSPDTAREERDDQGNVRCAENIHMDGLAVWSFLNSVIPPHVTSFIARNGLALDQIDQFIFHQASKLTIDSLIKKLHLPPDRVFFDVSRIGNTVSASIPFALKAVQEAGRLKNCSTAILCGFGVGMSYGSILLDLRSSR